MYRALVVLTVLVPAFVMACTANAAIIDTVGVDVFGTAYTGPGVLDTSSRTWELKPTTGDTFTLAGSTVTITYGGHGAGSINDTPAGITLFDDYKFTSGAAFGVVLTGLDPQYTYNVVYYGAQDGFGGRGTTFDLAEPDLPAATTSAAQTLTFAEGVNYVRYDNLIPQLGDDRIRVLVGIGPAGSVGIINGFEIQATLIPEPATWIMFGMFSLAVLGYAAIKRRVRA